MFFELELILVGGRGVGMIKKLSSLTPLDFAAFPSKKLGHFQAQKTRHLENDANFLSYFKNMFTDLESSKRRIQAVAEQKIGSPISVVNAENINTIETGKIRGAFIFFPSEKFFVFFFLFENAD